MNSLNNSSSKVVAIIPSRLNSSRLPNKALADIDGMPMIVHVFKRCLLSNSLSEVYVATDSIAIKNVVESYGGNVIMTSSHHETGTDRIAEAAQLIDADIIVNVQGDEALVNPKYIDKAVNALHEDPKVNVSILVNSFSKKNSISDIKTVLNEDGYVMYFSRLDIPLNVKNNNNRLLKAYHIVPFRKAFLLKFSKWRKGELEKVESNEYLRILEKGYKIRAVHVESDAISVDTVEDLEYVRDVIKVDPYLSKYNNPTK